MAMLAYQRLAQHYAVAGAADAAVASLVAAARARSGAPAAALKRGDVEDESSSSAAAAANKAGEYEASTHGGLPLTPPPLPPPRDPTPGSCSYPSLRETAAVRRLAAAVDCTNVDVETPQEITAAVDEAGVLLEEVSTASVPPSRRIRSFSDAATSPRRVCMI